MDEGHLPTNLDDINCRLKRLYLSVGKNFDGNVAAHVHITRELTETGGTVSLTFSKGDDKLEIMNQIISVISGLAKLKDHLMKKMSTTGREPQLIEDEINLSDYLKIIVDLDNREKHGPRRESRSGKYPRIADVGRGLAQKDLAKPSIFEFNPFANKIKYENSVIVVTADIRDNNNEYIYSFSELVTKSIEKWEEVIKKYNLNV